MEFALLSGGRSQTHLTHFIHFPWDWGALYIFIYIYVEKGVTPAFYAHLTGLGSSHLEHFICHKNDLHFLCLSDCGLGWTHLGYFIFHKNYLHVSAWPELVSFTNPLASSGAGKLSRPECNRNLHLLFKSKQM